MLGVTVAVTSPRLAASGHSPEAVLMSAGPDILIDPQPGSAEAPVFGRAGTAPKIVADRRRHRRVPLTLLGRFMRENRHEYPCRMFDIAVGGAALLSPVDVALGERLVAQFDAFGALEGTVYRLLPGGFVLRFTATIHKREKLAAQITYVLNRPHLGDMTDRRADRLVPTNAEQSLTLAEGLTITCTVRDVSLTGAQIVTPARPQIGMEIKLGTMRCTVVRHHSDGIGVAFVDVQSANALRRYFG
jgi:hypothetical protein